MQSAQEFSSQSSRNTRQSRTMFTNPFASINTSASTPVTHPRASRSTSTSSTSSSSSTRLTSPSLNDILALGFSTASRNASLTGSLCSSRRPSCFSILEVEEEKAEFGEDVVGVLEPRSSVGFWGMREVLEGQDAGSRRGSCA